MQIKWWKSGLFASAVLFSGAAFGQQLHLKSRNVDTDPVRPEARRRPTQSGLIHQIIQFDHFPGVGDLDALVAGGQTVVSVIPDNALVVAGPEVSQIRGMRWVGELEPSDKLSPVLGRSVSPILAIVEFHADVQANIQQSIAAAEGLTFERPAVLLPNHIIVSASLDKLNALANHDEVAYIFPADPDLLMPGTNPMPCAGTLTLAGPIAQYANVLEGWGLDADHMAHLGYAFGTLTTKVPAATVESEILRAMNAWSAVTNVVFQAASAAAPRTVFVEFASGAHGDPYPFDSAGTILAHTFYPVPLNPESIAGDVHLNAAENWHAGGDIDIYTVALHELGHAIGLGHSDNPGDVMYPYYRRGTPLSSNDIGAARALYGAPDSATPGNVPITVAPAVSPLSLTLNSITPPGQAAQTTIAGTVSGGTAPLALQYETDHGYSGKIAAGASGTWSASGVPLVTGTNTVTVAAFDSANHTASQSATVTRAATLAASVGPVSVLISSPSSAVTTAKGATISVTGKASGGVGITQVTWQTSTGASGTATGTIQWVASNIPLLAGTNTIIIRAFDATGASAWASVVVVRS